MSYFSEIWAREKKGLRCSLRIIICLKGCSVPLKMSLKKEYLVLLILLEKRNRLKRKRNLQTTSCYESFTTSRLKTQFLFPRTNLLGRTSNAFRTFSTPNTCNKLTGSVRNQRTKSTMMNTWKRGGDSPKSKRWLMIIKWESGPWKTWRCSSRTRHLPRCWRLILFPSRFP